MNALVHDNIACLEQGIALLQSLSPEQYTRKCPSCFNSAIGGHLRHNTDHYESFLDHYESGSIDYDDRERDARIESDPAFAVALLTRLRDALQNLPDSILDQPLRIKMDSGDISDWSRSSVRRELQFLLSHTIHHYALIVAMGPEAGIQRFPDHFGIAPSTLKFRQKAS